MSNPAPAQILKKAADFLDRKDAAKAQKQLAAGVKLYPNNYEIAVAYAQVAEQLKQWPAAAERWKQVRKKFPDAAMGYSAGILALLMLNKDDEAARVGEEGAEKFKNDLWFLNSRARGTLKAGDFDGALKIYQSIQAQFPDKSTGFVGAIEAQIGAGRYDEAEAISRESLAKFPDDVWFAHFHAAIAMSRRDWPAAVRRWDDLLAKFPGHKVAAEHKARSTANL